MKEGVKVGMQICIYVPDMLTTTSQSITFNVSRIFLYDDFIIMNYYDVFDV